MIIDGLVPERVVTLVAAATIFVVMFTLGLGIVLSEFRGVVRDSGLVGRALFAVLVAVPVLAVVVVRAFDLPRPVQVGTVLDAGVEDRHLAVDRMAGDLAIDLGHVLVPAALLMRVCCHGCSLADAWRPHAMMWTPPST